MKIISMLGRGLLLSVTSLVVGLWIMVMVLQFTLFNRQAVLGWLDNSGAYSNVVGAVVSLQSNSQVGQSLEVQSLTKAIANTLTPDYIKQSTETVVNAVFDWLDGEAETITFSIPINEKRDELQRQLAAALAPQLGSLPACESNFSGISLSEVDCLPRGSDAEEAAQVTAEQVLKSSDFLSEPITEKALGDSVFGPISQLPAAVQSLKPLGWVLPVLLILFGAGYVLISKERLRGGRKLASAILLGTSISAAVGAVMWLFGKNIELDQVTGGQEAELLANVVQPLTIEVVTSVGFWVTVFAGGVTLACIVAWIVLIVVSKKAHRVVDQQSTVNDSVADVAAKPVETEGEAEQAQKDHKPEDSKQDPPIKTVGTM